MKLIYRLANWLSGGELDRSLRHEQYLLSRQFRSGMGGIDMSDTDKLAQIEAGIRHRGEELRCERDGERRNDLRLTMSLRVKAWHRCGGKLQIVKNESL